MCGRYTLTWPLPAILEQLEFTPTANLTWQPRYNIAPGTSILAVIDRKGVRFGGFMGWGLSVSWSPSRRLINARRETLLTRPTFRDLTRTRRAIVPADGYYEWSQVDRQPYRITDPNHGLWYFAAIYQERPGHLAEIAIVTTEASQMLLPLHPRMPLILSKDAVNLWLDRETQAFEAILAMPMAPPTQYFPVSSAVNRASAEGPQLIVPQTSS